MPEFSGPSARMNNHILTPPATSNQKTASGAEAAWSTTTSSRSVSAIETLKQLKAELLQGNIDLSKSQEVQLADRTITLLERGKGKDTLAQAVIGVLQKKLRSNGPARTPVAEKPGVSEKKQQARSAPADAKLSESESLATPAAGNTVARPSARKKPATSADATAKPESGAAIPQWKQALIDKRRARKGSADSAVAHGKQPVAEEKASHDVSSAKKTQASLVNDAPPPPPAPPAANNQTRIGNKKIRSGGKKQSEAALKVQEKLNRKIKGEKEVDPVGLLNAIKSRRRDYDTGVVSDTDTVKRSPETDYLKCIWDQMETYTVQDDSGNFVTKYPLTTEGKTKYMTDRFSDFLFRQIEPQLMISLERGNKELVLKLFKKAESIWVSNHAGGEGRRVATSPWSKRLEEEQDKLSYGMIRAYLKGNHSSAKNAIREAVEKVLEDEIEALKKTVGNDPEKMMQEAERKYGIPGEIRTEEQKKDFLEEFADVLLYANTRSIKNDVLQPKDCSLKLLVPLITENLDEINRIRLTLMARTTRQFNNTESEMREMHDSLVKMGYQGSYDDYVHRRFDL